MKRRTCALCPHMEIQDIPMSAKVAVCQKTGMLVPHRAKMEPAEPRSFSFTFWRVPVSCPLPDSDVVKSEEKQLRSDWDTITLQDRKQ